MALKFPAWFIQGEDNCLHKFSCIQVKEQFGLSPNDMYVYSTNMVRFFIDVATTAKVTELSLKFRLYIRKSRRVRCSHHRNIMLKL